MAVMILSAHRAFFHRPDPAGAALVSPSFSSYELSAFRIRQADRRDCLELVFGAKHAPTRTAWRTAFYGGLIVGIPFLLILKQPDLGTALVLFPITLVMFYFGDMHPLVVRMHDLAGMRPPRVCGCSSF